MAAARPFASVDDLAAAADRTWRELSKDDWLEAFAAHARIGASEKVAGTGPAGLHPPPNSVAGTGPAGLHPPPNSVAGTGPAGLHPPDRSRAWSQQEQSGTRSADPETLTDLSEVNREYAKRFGHVFLVCATGRSAAEMLALARERLENDPGTELAIAAEEQRKITRLRLEKLFPPTEPMNAITTHVLDTSRGLPAEGVTVTLEVLSEEGWKWLGGSRTDGDGRARDLFDGEVPEGTYRLTFDTASYFTTCGVEGFFPIVQLVFKVLDPSRPHHVPLLLSPFGYSTYRGS